jgi:hypothetical protein
MSTTLCDPAVMAAYHDPDFRDWVNGRLNSTRARVEWWDGKLDARTREEIELGRSSSDPWLANRLHEIAHEALDQAREETYRCLDYVEGSEAFRKVYGLLALIELLQGDYRAAQSDGKEVIAHGGKDEIEALAVRPDVPQEVKGAWTDAVLTRQARGPSAEEMSL